MASTARPPLETVARVLLHHVTGGRAKSEASPPQDPRKAACDAVRPQPGDSSSVKLKKAYDRIWWDCP